MLNMKTMSPVIENYANIKGRIIAVMDHPQLPGYQQLKVSLENSYPITGFPNLAAADEGADIFINIKKDNASAINTTLQGVYKSLVKKVNHKEYFYTPG